MYVHNLKNTDSLITTFFHIKTNKILETVAIIMVDSDLTVDRYFKEVVKYNLAIFSLPFNFKLSSENNYVVVEFVCY